MVYDTRIISDSDEDLQYAAQLIKDGKPFEKYIPREALPIIADFIK